MSIQTYQPGIFEGVPAVARYAVFDLAGPNPTTPAIRAALLRLAPLVNGGGLVLGIGPALAATLAADIPGLHELSDLSGNGVTVPSTPGALWCWLRGDDPGVLLHLSRKVRQALAPAFAVREVVDAFRHAVGESGIGKDLTGYEDGTENPTGAAAQQAAFAQGQGEGLDGASFVAVQQWVHDLDRFDALSSAQRDNHIGRRASDNEELDDAPASAHVKRTAQEDYDPPAFMLRRSMPWTAGMQAGLMFVAFGESLSAFERQLRRMAGHDDGIVDALFSISQPVNGAYFWCPPMRDGKLDLRRLGL